MKTIELMISGQKAQFTTKSVTIDGKEYFYSNMTKLDHSPIVHTYRFEYSDGDAKLLTYDKKDTKIMAAIFSQVHKMLEGKKAKAAEKPVEPEKAVPAAEPEAPAKAVEDAKPAVDEDAKAEAEEKAAAVESTEQSDAMDEMVKATIALNEERAKKDAEKAAKKARKKAIREAKKNGTPLPEEEKTEGSDDIVPMDPEKKERLIKSLKIFGIIVGVIIVLSVVYYFVFGTSNAPSDANPNYNESQQYDDIDELIDDLQ